MTVENERMTMQSDVTNSLTKEAVVTPSKHERDQVGTHRQLVVETRMIKYRLMSGFATWLVDISVKTLMSQRVQRSITQCLALLLGSLTSRRTSRRVHAHNQVSINVSLPPPVRRYPALYKFVEFQMDDERSIF